jgi:hypothetical protein
VLRIRITLMRIWIRILSPTFPPDLDSPMLQNDPLRLSPFHFDADPDHAFHFNADPDPAFYFDADPLTDPASKD